MGGGNDGEGEEGSGSDDGNGGQWGDGNNEGRCAAITNCLIRKASLPHLTANNMASSSKVTPQPTMPLSGVTGAPRLVRSHAVSRDLVRDWNFDEVVME
ncbi:hypothetical protein RJ640_029924, partial [Escallonia rubra]